MRTQAEVDKLLQETMREIGKWTERLHRTGNNETARRALLELGKRAALLRWFSGEDCDELSR